MFRSAWRSEPVEVGPLPGDDQALEARPAVAAHREHRIGWAAGGARIAQGGLDRLGAGLVHMQAVDAEIQVDGPRPEVRFR